MKREIFQGPLKVLSCDTFEHIGVVNEAFMDEGVPPSRLASPELKLHISTCTIHTSLLGDKCACGFLFVLLFDAK